MSEQLKEEKKNLNPGEARSPYKSYTEYLSEDSQKVPAVILEEHFEYLGSQDLSMERYTSEDFFKKESESMWTRVWQFACRTEDIPNVGDSLVYDILNWSFILVRSEKDKISAYYNSCLH